VIEDTSVGDLNHPSWRWWQPLYEAIMWKMLPRYLKIAEYSIFATSISGEVTPITARAASGLLFLGQHRGFPLF
jgi:hypothetical protein